MPLKIITADERLARPAKINIAVFGPSGVGKTTLARTLDPATTLFLDGEAGTLALGDWRGSVVPMREAAAGMGVHPWEMARAIACLLAGADPADTTGPYSTAAHAAYTAQLGAPDDLFRGVETIFVDSITVASRWAFAWAQLQPGAFNKEGKPDQRAAYGLLGQEMVKWLTMLQHSDRSVIVVGILDEKKDDFGRITFEPQIEGSSTGRALPGIFDTVLTLSRFKPVEGGGVEHDMAGGSHRAVVCGPNPWGLPGKDRSGRLAMLEQPHLGGLIAKMRNGPRQDAAIGSAIGAPSGMGVVPATGEAA